MLRSPNAHEPGRYGVRSPSGHGIARCGTPSCTRGSLSVESISHAETVPRPVFRSFPMLDR